MTNADDLVNLRVERTADGRQAVLADICGGSRVLFGFLSDKQTYVQIGGMQRAVFKVE
jgi:hypothetical protein